MRFIATADWQLGMTAHFLNAEARPRYAQARIDVLRRIGDLATEHQAEFIVVAGDVFESNQLDRAVLGRAFDALKDVPVPVYLLPGNHDPLDASSIYRSAEFERGCPPHVRVLDHTGPHVVAEGVELIAAPWFSKKPLLDLCAQAIRQVDPSPHVRRIVIGHGDLLAIDQTNPAGIDAPGLLESIGAGDIDFVVLGDRHSLTEHHARLWYPGTPEVTSRDEVDPGNVLVVELTDKHVRVLAERVGHWKFLDHRAHLNTRHDVEELQQWLQDQPNKQTTAVWLSLTGELTVADKARLDEVIDSFDGLFAVVAVWERHTDLVVRPADGEFESLGLTGFAHDAVNELVSHLDGPDAQASRDALSLLYRLSGGMAR